MAELTKEMLNKKLGRIISNIYDSLVVEYDMISAKWVDVRADRECYGCGSVIPKGTTALTSSRRNRYGDKFRIHRCYLCGESIIKHLDEVNHYKKTEEMERYALEDAFGPLGLGQD